MSDDKPDTSSHQQIPALWFDSKGRGPDEFLLEIVRMKDLGEGIPQAIGVRIRAGDLVILGRTMIDGGFMLDEDAARKLRDALDATLT